MRLTRRASTYSIYGRSTSQPDGVVSLHYLNLDVSCLEQDISAFSIRLGVDSSLGAQINPTPSQATSSVLLRILNSKFCASNSIIEGSGSALHEIFSVFPGSLWARVETRLKPLAIKEEVLTLRSIIFNVDRPEGNNFDNFRLFDKGLMEASYGSTCHFSFSIGGISQKATCMLKTRYHYPLLREEQPRRTFAADEPDQARGSGPGDSSGHDSVFDLHRDVFRSALPESYDDVQELAQRCALAAFLLSDNKPQMNPLMSLSLRVEILCPRKPPDQSISDLRPEKLKLREYTILAAETSMNHSEYNQMKRSTFTEIRSSQNHKAFVALGSNVGERIPTIERACRSMEVRGLKVIRTSALYETAPMYLEDQNPFINGVCQIETSLSPSKLLGELKAIEKDFGRQKTVENGPRPIDLDILLYDEEKVDLEHLTIPHQRISEREFVLRPLCDLIPNAMPPSVRLIPTFRERLEALPKADTPLSPLTPLSSSVEAIRSEAPNRKTQHMAILNLTPDSFSDGGIRSTDPSSLDSYLESLISSCVTILDIGGQSTRPNAPEVSTEEEIARTLPTIRYIRTQHKFDNLVLSIDTYRASVAVEAVEAGANIVNDVSAGTLDPEMLPTIARLGCTVVLMHMRGTPATMSGMTYYPDGVIAGVGKELLARVAAAEAAGIRRWRIILDPGIGFAKTQAQNIELLQRFGELRAFEGLRGIPWVVGASRKGFIGKITGVQEASERVMGTAATVCAAIQGGADIVRVHDVKEMVEVTKMADAIWRV